MCKLTRQKGRIELLETSIDCNFPLYVRQGYIQFFINLHISNRSFIILGNEYKMVLVIWESYSIFWRKEVGMCLIYEHFNLLPIACTCSSCRGRSFRKRKHTSQPLRKRQYSFTALQVLLISISDCKEKGCENAENENGRTSKFIYYY